jgi:hypothetical protein
MSSNYSRTNYSKLIEHLEELDFPYNDTLIEILYKFDETDNIDYSFYYAIKDELIQDTSYKILTFNKHSQYNIATVMDDININDEGEFFPFLVTEDGNYVGLFISDIGEEKIKLYSFETEKLFQIYNENQEELTLEDFLNKM